MSNTNKNLLTVKNLTVTFKTEEKTITAARNVSFELSEGEILGLVGESGSGKSVTGMGLLRLIPTPPGRIESGSVCFNGKNLLNLPIRELRRVRGKDIGIIFQEPITALSPLHTIGDQLMESLILHNQITKHSAWITSMEWLTKVGIPDPERQMNAYPFQFSGGMRQRVMIAMVLMLNPRIIIADEPTTAVDVTTQRRIFELILRIKKRKTSLILITHDMGVVWQLCDRVLVMKDAEIIENGPLEKIFKNPSEVYTQKLLSSVPRLDSPPRRSRIEITDQTTLPSAEIREVEPPIVQINNLRTWFPIRRGIFARTIGFVKAVDGVSLSINTGETFALVGESGSGKTTLGRSILGLDRATDGDIFFRKFNLNKAKSSELKSLRRSLQIIFQDPFSSLNPRMTIADIVTEGLIEHKLLNGNKEDTAVRLLEEVGLNADHLYRYPHEFSGGQRQRICLSRAISLKPEFVVCDEALSALDVTIQAQILDLLIELQNKYNLSYLFITHDLGVVKEIADRVAVMKDGKIIEEGSTTRVLESPHELYTKELISAVPNPGDDQSRLSLQGLTNF